MSTSHPYMTRRRLLEVGAAGSLLAMCAGNARAQPAAPLDVVKVICGFPPGSSSDVTARTLADRLARNGYAGSGVVENKTGAGAQIAVQFVKAQAPDGRTLLQTPMSMLGIYPHTYRRLPYDPVKDLTPVSLACTFDFGLAVGPAVPPTVRSVAEFLAWAKANPSKASFGGPAAGAVPHFIGVLLGRSSGVELTHVAYRGTHPAIQDVIGGQLPAVIGPVGDILRYVGQPGYRVLATSGASRSRFSLEIPTLTEQGYKDFVYTEWYGIYMPPGATAATVARTNSAVRAALGHPDVVKSLGTMGMEASSSSAQELTELLRKDTERWGPIVRSVGFTVDS